MNNISLLLVEGSPEERTLIQEYLAAAPSFQCSLTGAESLEASQSLLEHDDFDVVLLDLELPDSSGLNTARRMISELRETVVIVLSNPQDEEIAEQAVRYGTEDYIQKRFLSAAMLVKSIRYAMERKKIIQEKYDVLSDLVLALEKIDYLESLLPICIGCSKICGEDNHWLELDEFARQKSKAKTRLICSDCKNDLVRN